jgi:capsular exopolysaccharide synthesis family protein
MGPVTGRHPDRAPIRPGEPAAGSDHALRGPQDDMPALARLWGILANNALLIAGCAAVVVATTGLATWRVRRTYEATASIRIEQSDARLASFTTEPQVAPTTPTELPTEFQVLQSRTLAEAVVDSLCLQVELRAPATVWRDDVFLSCSGTRRAEAGRYRLTPAGEGRFLVRDRTSGATLGAVPAGAALDLHGVSLQLAPAARRYPEIDVDVYAFDDAVDRLQRSVRVRRRSPEANILDVSYTGTDPRLVQLVPNVLAARFVQSRQSDRHAQARSAAQFLSDQIAKLGDQLSAAEDSLRSFEEANGVVSLTEETGTGLAHAAELQAKRDGIEAERSALTALVATVRDSMRRDPATGVLAYRNLVAFPTLLHNDALTQLLGSLTIIEDRRSDLLSRRSPDDSDVQALTARSHQLGDQLGGIALEYLQGLANQVNALDTVLAQSRRPLDRIPAEQLELARRQRAAKGLEEIVTLLQSRLKEAEIAQAVEDPSVRLLDVAILPHVPVSPRPLLNLCLALVFGLGLGSTAAFAREYLDGTVRSRHDVQLATGASVLGLLPRANRGDAGTAVIRRDSPLSLIEAYNLLGTNLGFAARDSTLFAVTSAMPGEGKTTVAVNLALTLAWRGRRVLLIDADLRQGMIATVLGIPVQPGFSDVLSGTAPFGTAVSRVSIPDREPLHVLGRGQACENPVSLLGSLPAAALFGSLRDQFDTIIVDCPPANLVADASVLATYSDGVLVVARAAVTDSQALAFARDQLARAGAPVVGVVLNDLDFRRDAAYDAAYRYYARGQPRAPRVRRRLLPYLTPLSAMAAGLASVDRPPGDEPD